MSRDPGSTRTLVFRAVAAVVLGYLCFALGLSGLVILWFVRELVASSPLGTAVLLGGLAILGATTGAVARIAGAWSGYAARVLAGLVVVVTLANIVLDVAAEPLWFKLTVLAVTPAAILFVEFRLRGAATG